MHYYSDQDVSDKIEELETQFRDLHTCILDELEASKAFDIQKVLHALTLLPTKLRNEYQKLILDKLATLRSEKSISELFLHLNPLFSFLDYSLLEHIIKSFGSTSLKDRMKSYCHEVQNFMNRTTVQQLIDCNWPCEEEIAQNISKMVATIKRNPRTCNLVELDAIRRKICIQARLVDVICAVVSVKNSHSFVVNWSVPSVLAPDMIKLLELADDGFFKENDIHSLSVGDKLVYSPLTKFSDKLRKRYQLATQTTVSHTEWIASPTRKVFRLAMIQREQVQHGRVDDQFVKMTITGKIDDILHSKSPIELRNILRDKERQIVLIEGAPGSGKTTLTIFICQKWGKRELFQQFTAVILVQLRDPAVQRAQTIADLLPVENATVAQELAAELIATNGRGVLWVLDGWDELPSHLQQDSIFCKLLPPNPSEQKLAEIEKDPVYSKHIDRECSKVELWLLYLQNNPGYRTQYYKDRLLNEISIIVTSRPISSGDLQPVVSSRIEVLGFTPEEQRQYFTECLKGDTKALEALLQKIQENPVVQSSCYLPLNAALTMHYFKVKGCSLPSSEYEVFSINVLHCIRRHFEREGRGRELPAELTSLDDLSMSEAVREPFQCLCELAYRGVMENKVTFSSSDLPQGSNTLSLLQAIESFLQSGKSVFYNFIHLSFQELFAGYYIATSLSDSEQVSQFHQLFYQPRFVGVFQFYAAITKLKTPGIDKIISEIVSKESKSHLLSLLRCLYEAQDPFHCQSVVNQLGKLDVSRSSLSPMDLLSIGYLIGMSNTRVVMEVNLGHCYIGDYGIITLMKYLTCGEYAETWVLDFDLSVNNICEEGVASIAEILQNNDLICSLNLTKNPIGAGGLQSLAEALITNTSLFELNLSECLLEITDENGPIVTEMLQRNTTLRNLILFDANISEGGVVYIAQGLEENSALEYLVIEGLNEVDGETLASTIATNTSLPLDELHLRGYDMITEDNIQVFIDLLQQNTSIETLNFSFTDMSVPFLAEALQNNTTLKELELCHCELTLDMVKDVSRMLTVNCSLTSLNISENPIGDNGVTHLVEALKQNKTLEELGISDCGITDAGVAALAEALRQKITLERLYINRCGTTDAGVAPLAEALKQNKTLERLDISGCGITDAGVAPLAEALKQNKTLESLDISLCGITDAGVAPLAEALKQNKTLESLDISYCLITDAGVTPLAEALQVNSSLRRLIILGNKLTENGLTKLRELAANKSNFNLFYINN